MFKRGLVAVVAALLIGVLLSACGSSNSSGSSGSSADPAAVVPASAPLYLSVDVPDSGQLSTYRTIITKFAGAQAWNRLSRGFTHTLASNKLTYAKDFAPWIGAKVGLAFTSFTQLEEDSSSNSPAGLVIIFPTTNLSAAEAFAKRAEKRSGGFSYRADGNYMLVGTKATLASFTAASGPKLSASPGYEAIANSAGNDEAMAYGNVHTLFSTILSAAVDKLGSTGASNPLISTLAADEAKLPADATVGLGLGATNHAISFDVVPHDLSSASSSNGSSAAGSVASLPSDAIAALALNLTIQHPGAVEQALSKAFSSELGSGGIGGLGGLGGLSGLGGARVQTVEKQAESLVSSVLPALGPLDFAVSGTSLLGIEAGLVMTPSSQAAATKLLTLVHSAIESSPNVQVTGTPQNFSVALGPYTANVSDTTGKILALVGYPNASALLKPSATLASNGAYKQAVSQLPSGASVPFYLSFSSIDKLIAGLSTENAQTKRVLSELSYLVLGTSSGDDRLVLGLN
jgi:hypothetical protein